MLKTKLKPPLGVIPHSILDMQRVDELKGAINRYLDVNLPVDKDWVTEYNQLINKLNNN